MLLCLDKEEKVVHEKVFPNEWKRERERQPEADRKRNGKTETEGDKREKRQCQSETEIWDLNYFDTTKFENDANRPFSFQQLQIFLYWVSQK